MTGVCAQSHTHCMQIYKEFSSRLVQFGSFVQSHSCRGRTDECSRVTRNRREKTWTGTMEGTGRGSRRTEPGATVLTRQVAAEEESLPR